MITATTAIAHSITSNITIGGLTNNNTDALGRVALIARNPGKVVFFDEAPSTFNKGITVSGHSGIHFKESVTTMASQDTLNMPILTVNNYKVFSTSLQSLSITADIGVPVVDLQGGDNVQGGLIKAKGTPEVEFHPETLIYQSNNGSRVEIHGRNFGTANNEIIVNFDQTVTPGISPNNQEAQPTETTDTLIIVDFDGDTSQFTGYLRCRVERARVPSDNAILGTFKLCPKLANGQCNQTAITPVVSKRTGQLASSAPYLDVYGSKFVLNHTKVYVSIPPGQDGNYNAPGWQFSGTPLSTGFNSTQMTITLGHGYDPKVYGLTDNHVGPLVVVVAVYGIRSLDTYSANGTSVIPNPGLCSSVTYYTHGYCGTQVAVVILKPFMNAKYTTTARSPGLNRIEISGHTFGEDGAVGIEFTLASGFTPAEVSMNPPVPVANATVFQTTIYTVTNTLAVLDIPEDTFHATGFLYALITRRGGPSLPQVVGTWAEQISRPALTPSTKERVASATTLPVYGAGFLNVSSDVQVYLMATNGIAGEHLGVVRSSNFTSTNFMLEQISGLKDPINIGSLDLIVTVQTVKSVAATVADIIQIPIVNRTEQRVAKFGEGNRMIVNGMMFGTDASAVNVELFSQGISFHTVIVVTCKDTELVIDSLVDSIPGTTNATIKAIVWRSGGPTQPQVIGVFQPALHTRPTVTPSNLELCSSTQVLKLDGGPFGNLAADVNVFLTATNGVIGEQTAIVQTTNFTLNSLLLTLGGITDAQAGPLRVQVSLQSVVSVEQQAAVVHRGSQDIFWESQARSRFVTTRPSRLNFNATHTLTTSDQVAILHNQYHCTGAASLPYTSNGTHLRRFLSPSNSLFLPSGEGNDTSLVEGDYALCVCDIEEGDTGCDADSEYQLISKQLEIIEIPRVGVVGETRLRAVTRSSPSFRVFATNVKLLQDGEFIFFTSSNCSAIPSVDWANETTALVSFAADGVGSTRFRLPSVSPLEATSSTEGRTLTTCFAPAQSGGLEAVDYVKLNQTLFVFPEPTVNMVTSFFVNMIFELSFDLPSGNAGEAGDMVVLEPDECISSYLQESQHQRIIFPLTRGLKGTVQSGGVLREMGIAQGKFNELPAYNKKVPGVYKVCYATRTSEGTETEDFFELQQTIEIKDPTQELPVMEVPISVVYGTNIEVAWKADNGFQDRQTPAGSWLGLYVKDDCIAFNVDRHKCHLATRELEEGTAEGTVVFTVSDYRAAGDFEVRYFRGDSRHGQGVVCRGMPGIQDTFLQCLLEETITSSVISVDRDDPIAVGQSTPGIEAVFSQGEESYDPPTLDDEVQETRNNEY